MHLLLVGPGALGCLLSTVISKGIGNDRLTILDYNANRADYLSTHGIVYRCEDAEKRIEINAVSDPLRLQDVDAVLLCVKSYQLAESLEFCRPLLTDCTLVIFLQNGISHLAMDNHLHRATAAYGTTTEGSTLLATGHVHHAGRGVTTLGFREPSSARFVQLLEKVCTVLASGGLQVEIACDIVTRLWAKLFINVGINALTATLGCRNGQLLSLPGVADRMHAAVDEAVQVARAHTISIPPDPYRTVESVCKKTSQNISSMLQDVRNKRRTEIDSINGAIVALGKTLHIDTPENALLCNQVKILENSYRTE
ncbi:MAG: ketopantoate reductase family protein [Desulforhopalus sp.]